MIGQPLSERYALSPLDPERAEAAMNEWLPSQASPIIEVRARGAGMVACLVARADRASLRLCKSLGLRMKRGATCVFGLDGADAARLFPLLGERQRAFLVAPAGARETKVVLVAGGLAVLSIEARDGATTITAVPFDPPANG